MGWIDPVSLQGAEGNTYVWMDIEIDGAAAGRIEAVCCSVLQCVAVCCSVLQQDALRQCVAVCCSVLQCVAAGRIEVPQSLRQFDLCYGMYWPRVIHMCV